MARIKILEQNQNKLILRSQDALWWAVTISVFLLISGIFWCLLSLLLVKDRHTFEIFLSIVSECIFSAFTLYFISKLFEVITYTFDRFTNCIHLQKHSRLKILKTQIVEVPFKLIFGVEVEAASGDEGGIGYYTKLIFKSIHWRIYLRTNGQYQSAVEVATAIADFLNLPYFSERSPAPSPVLPQQILEKVEPELFSWRYLQEEINRLRQHLNFYSDDAEAHLSLGFLLYYANKRFNRKKAVIYLQQAGNLFER